MTKMIDRTNGLIKAFDVNEAPCMCEGTEVQDTYINVIPVRWRFTSKNTAGKIRFQCMRCKHRWTRTNVPWANGEMMVGSVGKKS